MFGPELTPQEIKSLRILAGPGILKPAIPDEHAQRLIELGLASQLLGGLAITDRGMSMLIGRQP
jgi:hypothetical protein